jgi:hypothetical protein
MNEKRSKNRRESDQEGYSIKEWIEKGFGNIDEKLERIETQVLKTNGRVTKLEWWRMFLVGTAVVFPIFTATVISLSLKNLDYKIAEAIDTAFSQLYEVDIKKQK